MAPVNSSQRRIVNNPRHRRTASENKPKTDKALKANGTAKAKPKEDFIDLSKVELTLVT